MQTVNGAHLVVLVRAGAVFKAGKLVFPLEAVSRWRIPLRCLAKLLREDLPAEPEAFIADGRRLVLFASWRGHEGLHLDPCFSAERAEKLAAGGYRLQLRILRRSPGSGDADGGHDAGVADVHAGPCDELADLSLLAPAEGTDPLGCGFLAAPSSPPANAAVLDDLVDALVADAEGFGNLAHRCACQVQASDRSTVFRLGCLELVLELSDPASRGGGLGQQVLINRHLSTLHRQMRPETPPGAQAMSASARRWPPQHGTESSEWANPFGRVLG